MEINLHSPERTRSCKNRSTALVSFSVIMLVDNIHLSLALKKKNQAHDKDENDNSAVGSELYVLSKVHI